jgi:hypothetical protein
VQSEILSTEQVMNPARKVTVEHAQGIVVNDESLLPILEALHSAIYRCTLFETLYAFGPCVLAEI